MHFWCLTEDEAIIKIDRATVKIDRTIIELIDLWTDPR